MPDRFIFRQVYCGDLATFLTDREIRAKLHIAGQRCHQTSYQAIVDRRGTAEFPMPCGGVVNDYVPFYFSPLTSFTYTIHKGNVPLTSPTGINLGVARSEDRIFIVCKVDDFRNSGLQYCFSNFPLNSEVPRPILNSNLDELETHVFWDVFDEFPHSANIPEIGYNGVCSYFHNTDAPERQLRRQKRMAEFLVRDAVPLSLVKCVVANNLALRDRLQRVMDVSGYNIPIYVNAGCYF